MSIHTFVYSRKQTVFLSIELCLLIIYTNVFTLSKQKHIHVLRISF